MSSNKKDALSFDQYVDVAKINDAYATMPFSNGDTETFFEKIKAFRNFFQQNGLRDLVTSIAAPIGKKSFLVFKHNKYVSVPTENIAFFYIRHECTVIVCLDRQEFLVDHSLEQIQNLVSDKQFFRVNRQYLINFSAVKEVEHYFARKLLVNLFNPTPEKLLVPKEKSSQFLHWLDNR